MIRCRFTLSVTTALLLLAPIPLLAQASPTLRAATKNITDLNPTTTFYGVVWLKLQGEAGLAQQISAIYAPGSDQYHQFLSWETIAPHLPTSAQMQAVLAQMQSHNITVRTVDPHNLYVSISGAVPDVEAAFGATIQLRTLNNGNEVKTFSVAPELSGSAAGLVRAITSAGDEPYQPQAVHPTDPLTGQPLGVESLEQAAIEASSTDPKYCVLPSEHLKMRIPGETLPVAEYEGPIYGTPLSEGQLSSTKPCAYTPAQFYKQTGLDEIHAEGYTGNGQTIAILEENGSATIRKDLKTFDSLYNLQDAKLKIDNLNATDPTIANNPEETTLDVEWAHAVAPDADLYVVESNTLQLGVIDVLEKSRANVISISYGSPESIDSADAINSWNEVVMVASSFGVSVDVSSGDYGDQIANVGIADVGVPSDSPYSTSVGGLSIFEVPGRDRLYKTSWGRNITLIGTDGLPNPMPFPIPLKVGEKFGGGGGESRQFPLPAYQTMLGGTGRHTPDVSDIANEMTGLEIVVTDPAICQSTDPCVTPEGGTSLAAPVFTGKWVLLEQLHGTSLGQAAPLIAQYASTPAIEDIVPMRQWAVSGKIQTTAGTQAFSPSQLANLPKAPQSFVSTLWQSAANFQDGATTGSDYVISLNTDSTLAVTKGYDYATGWGQLDVKAIFQGLAPDILAK
jgi:subtilase family serine protease